MTRMLTHTATSTTSDLEKAFREWQDEFLMGRLRIGLVCVIVAVTLFAALDMSLIPEARPALLASYSWHYVAFAVCGVLFHSQYGRRHTNLNFFLLTGSMLLVPQIWVTFGGRVIYNNSSWLLVILGMTLLIPIRARNHALMQVATLGYHLIFNSNILLYQTASVENTDIWVFIYTFLQLGVIFVISDISIYLYERLQKSNFFITEKLRQANQSLEEARNEAVSANTAKSNFLASMSHELRTPLNAIIGYAEILHEELDDFEDTTVTEELEEDVGNILVASQHLLALINNVLDLAKIEAGRMTVIYETVSVATLIEIVVATIQPLVTRQKNHFVLQNNTADLTLRTDMLKVRQILLNLLTNANKFTHEGTVTLEITAASTPREIIFQVTDTGSGMNPAQVEKLFTAFYQAQQEGYTHEVGTGLGLAISQQLCHMLGGRITVASTPQMGTCFTVFLPME